MGGPPKPLPNQGRQDSARREKACRGGAGSAHGGARAWVKGIPLSRWWSWQWAVMGSRTRMCRITPATGPLSQSIRK